MFIVKSFKPIKSKIYISNDDLDCFKIPEELKREIKKWSVIVKSPYSESFYSSDQIDWGYKPEGCYRVSDHWNFTARGSNRIHCVTDKEVENNKEMSLGKYEDGVFKILMSYPKLSKAKAKIERDKKVFNNEFYMNQRKEFKNKVKNGNISAEFDYYDHKIKGIVTKYTGFEIGLDILESNLSKKNGKMKKVKNLKLYDDGEEIENIFTKNYIKKFE